MNYIYLLYISELILFVIFFRLSGKDIMSPSVIFITVFIISTTFTLLNVGKWNVIYSFKAYFVLITGIFSFAAVDIIVKRKYDTVGIRQSFYRSEWHPFHIKKRKMAAVIVVDVVSLVLIYAEMTRIVNHYGFYGNNVISSYKILTSVLAIVDQEHSMNFIVAQMVKLIEVWGEIFLFLFLFDFVKTRRFRKAVYLIPSGLCAFMYILFSNRLGLIRMIAYMLCCYYILWHGYRGWNRNLTGKYIRTGIIILVVFLPVFYELTTVIGRNQSRSMFDYISMYVGASIQHFNQYIQDPPIKEKSFGGESLPILNNYLYRFGIVAKQSVVHLEFRRLYKGTSGNVYTFFRRLIQDYGYWGMYLVTMLISYVFSKYYRKKIRGCDEKIGVFCIRTVLYSHFFPWIMTASIEQTMFNYISVYNMIKCVLLVLSMVWLCEGVCGVRNIKR